MKYLLFILLFICVNIIGKSQDSIIYKYPKYIQMDSAIYLPNIGYKWMMKYSPNKIDKEWVLASGDGEEIVIYVNRDNIVRNIKEDNIECSKVWLKEYRLKQNLNGKDYENIYSFERVYIDCKNGKYKTTSVAFYDINDKLITSWELQETAKWIEPTIKSVGEGFLRKSCELINIKNKKQ